MDSEKSGWLYLTLILLFMAMYVSSAAGAVFGTDIIEDIIINESVILIPSILFAVFNKSDIKKTFRLKKVKISTLFLSILYTMLFYPLIVALNALSMTFTDNAMLGLSDEILAVPFPVTLFVFAFAAPLCEELAFRGAIFSGLRTSGKIFVSIVLQALMFGCMHLNFNQMMYAFAIGIAFGLIVEATGSIWTSYVGHMLINGFGVTALYYLSPMIEKITAESGISAEQTESPATMLMVAGFYGARSVATVAMAILLLKAIAANEGSTDALRNIFKKKNRGEITSPVISLPMILALIISVIIMIIIAVLG